jgi:S-adenosylmethionine hydrolase
VVGVADNWFFGPDNGLLSAIAAKRLSIRIGDAVAKTP